MPTVIEFTEEFRNDMSDAAGQGQSFTQTAIDRFRKKAIRQLYPLAIAHEVTNYTSSYTDMTLAGFTTLDYAMPTNWQRITGIEYWENTTNTFPVGKSALWDDRVREGYVRIFDAPDWANFRIHLIGLKKWTDVDDTSMPDEVYDVVLLGAELAAVKSLANRRARSRKSTSAQDVSLGSEVMWVRQMKQDYRDAVKSARKAIRSFR